MGKSEVETRESTVPFLAERVHILPIVEEIRSKLTELTAHDFRRIIASE